MLATTTLALVLTATTVHAANLIKSRSGLRPWVDVDTPEEVYTITSSRGDTWDLVMSDEFNVPNRSFAAGDDHLWTAIEMPDGVNAALEYYSVNMTSTVTESDGRGVFRIEVREDSDGINYTAYNTWAHPPKYENHSMFYRAGMVQSWNKFCFQGGRMEVSAKLPGAISPASNNPDLGDELNRVKHKEYYPTWPGIWLLGNLARSLFTGSTSRMWPWSYNECSEAYRKHQRISACDGNPGHGLNPHQGRGAPEIDLLEGAGAEISTSIQLAPGMPSKYRLFPVKGDDYYFCMYGGLCETVGANYPGVPSAIYAKRGYKSWYQGLRYAPNTLCRPESDQIQSVTAVKQIVKAGITDNSCAGVNSCPASRDGYGSLDTIDGANETKYWGINDVGGCMPVINGYMGAYLCDADSQDKSCSNPRKNNQTRSKAMPEFSYQMDAISANWGIPLRAYTGYLKYQLEWVMGSSGYVRWMIEDIVVFEIPAETIENPPQDDSNSNPKKIMIEEPMYIIFNIAVSTSWGTTPPNPGTKCRGDGSDSKSNKICDGFPMFMTIDYIRIYQDVSASSTMAIGCDPSTHPTAQFIEDHIDEYSDANNPWMEVSGGANCHKNEDCSVGVSLVVTGQCVANKCQCLSGGAWGGPRCTLPITTSNYAGASVKSSAKGFGPPLALSITTAALGLIALIFSTTNIIVQVQRAKETVKTHEKARKKEQEELTLVDEWEMSPQGASRSL